MSDATIPTEEKDFFIANDLLNLTCFAKCEKRKPKCSHPCQTFCHVGVACPELNCISMIKVFCPCKHKNDYVECGKVVAKDRIQLECDDKCKNIQRFKALYAAEEEQKKSYYSQSLVKFAQANLDFVRKIEQNVRDMYFNAESRLTYSFDKFSEEKVHFVVKLLSKHFFLDTSFLKVAKGFFIDAYKTEEFMLPKIMLSEYVEKMNRNEINPKSLPFEVVLRFFNLTVFDKMDHIEEHFQNCKDKFYIEKYGNAVYMYIWKESDLDTFADYLKSLNNNWSTFTVEMNRKKIANGESFAKSNDTDPKNSNESVAKEQGAEIWQTTPSKGFGDDDVITYPANIEIPSKSKKKKPVAGNIFAQLAK